MIAVPKNACEGPHLMGFQAAPEPADEAVRLKALTGLKVLDTAAEPQFDEIVKAAAMAFGATSAAVSLVDSDRQWFKAKTGLDACQTGRDVAFCAHAILDEAPFVVLNAALDARFKDNPLVVGEPFIRFYAGAPIRVRGQAMGSLCVFDAEPRFRFAEDQAQVLDFFARLTAERLVARAQRLAA